MPRATIHQLHTRQTPGADGSAYVPHESSRHPIARRLIDDLERRLRDDTPVHLHIDPPTWREELADDWRGFVAEVRRSPYSHALVALATVVGWTVLLVLPLVIGEWF